MGAAPSALAAQKPSVGLALAREVDASTPIAYEFTSNHVRSTEKLVLQREVGSAHVYRTVRTLPHVHSGSGSAPGLPLGEYRFRIAVLDKPRKGHRKVLASRRARVSVFGTVSLAHLLDNPSGGTYTSPTRTFPWVLRAHAFSVTGDTALTVSATRNHCRAIHFDFIPENNDYNQGDSSTLTVVQQSADPVSATAHTDELGALDVGLRPGESWSLKASLATGHSSTDIDVNGSAVCSSAAPVR
jgi:hypothetical protein